jgi:hypothetical protein
MTAAQAQVQGYDQAESEIMAGFAQTAIEGNLALVVDNSGKDIPVEGANEIDPVSSRKSKRPHLRLLKPNHDQEGNRAEVWQGAEEAHWLRNPVIFMGLCLVVMVMLILFW